MAGNSIQSDAQELLQSVHRKAQLICQNTSSAQQCKNSTSIHRWCTGSGRTMIQKHQSSCIAGRPRWPRSTLCFPWGRASSTSPQASIRPGRPRLGSPGRTATPDETLKGDVSFNVLTTVAGGLRNWKRQLYLNKTGPSANQHSKMPKDIPYFNPGIMIQLFFIWKLQKAIPDQASHWFQYNKIYSKCQRK